MDGDGSLTLKCKCGWETPATYENDEALAAEHRAQFLDDVPALTPLELSDGETKGSEA